MNTLLQDLRYARRTLLKSPGFTAGVVLTLALGIGAAAAIFSVVDSALLRPLPFEDPHRLAMIWGVAGPDRDIRGASYPEIRDWRELTQSFSDVSIYDDTELNLSGDAGVEELRAEIVSSNFFRLVGVSPRLGRGFLPEEELPGAAPSAVISHSLWERRFGGKPDVLGRTVTLGGGPGFADTLAVIVGVMPEGFRGVSFDAEIWTTLLPFAPDWGDDDDRGDRWLGAAGRLAPGISAEVAQADLAEVARQLEARYPDTNRERSADLFSLHEYHLDNTRTLLIVLLAAVGFLLLIACVNVVNLQLVRGIARGREMALRHALGAGRLRLVRQLTTEATVLALLGGIAGVILAHLGTEFLVTLVPEGVLPSYVDASIDGRVLLFAAGLVAFTGVLSGIVPALRSTRRGFAGEVYGSGRGATTASVGSGRLQRLLVAVEIALAVALMAGGALMVRSLGEQLKIAPGFEADNVLAVRVNLTDDAYAPEALTRFAQQLVERLEGTAGVAEVAVGSDAPLRGNSSASTLSVEGRPDQWIRYYRHRVSPGFFQALGIPIVRGRGFDSSDDLDGPGVVIVSEAFAGKLWPDRDPIGQTIQLGSSPDGERARVIGVAANVRFRSLTTDLMDPGEDPDVYLPHAQAPTPALEILVRSATNELTGIDIVRRAVAELDPSVPVADVQSLEDALAVQTANARFGSLVLGVFAALALALSAVGLYGIMAFLVASRRRETAIRIAVGADPARVLRMVVREGMTVVGFGAVVGLAGVFLAARLFSSLLYGVQPADPAAITAATAILLATALLANVVPARRATRIDPMTALREE